MEGFLDLVLDPLREVYSRFRLFFPNLLAMITIIVAGVLAAWAIKALLMRVFMLVKFDSWCDRMGLTALMRKGDVWAKPSNVTGMVTYWFLIIVVLMVGLNALNVAAIDNLVSQFFLYLPRIFSAFLILVVGYLAAGFFSRAALIAAVNSGFHYAKLLAEAVRILLIVLILAMSFEQLQVAPGIVVAAFSIIFGGIVLALVIAFGVGGIDAARRAIEQETTPKKEKEGEKGGDVEHI